MLRHLPFPIGEPTNATRIIGRENVPKGDKFSWWSSHSEYIDDDGESLTIEAFQDKHDIHWRGAWDIIVEQNLEMIDVYDMNVNHPRYEELVEDSGDIVFND